MSRAPRVLAPLAFLALALLASRALVDHALDLKPAGAPDTLRSAPAIGPELQAAAPPRPRVPRAPHALGSAPTPTSTPTPSPTPNPTPSPTPNPTPTPPAPERPLAVHASPLPPTPAPSGASLPLASSPPLDLAFQADAVRLAGGARVPAVERLVALAASGAGPAELSAALDREPTDLPTRLLARRWLAARQGAHVAWVAPRPARALVGGFSH